MNVKNFKFVIFAIIVVVMCFLMAGCVPQEYEMPDATGYNYNDGLIALDFDEDLFEVNEWFNLGDDVCIAGVIEKADKFVVSASQLELMHLSNVDYDEKTLEVGIYDIFDTYIGSTKDYDFMNSSIDDVHGCYIYSVETESDEDFVDLKAWLHDSKLTVVAKRIPKNEDILELHEYDSDLEKMFDNMLYLGGSIDSQYFMSFDDEGEEVDSLDK